MNTFLSKLLKKDINLSILTSFSIVVLLVLALSLGNGVFSERNLISIGFQVSEFGILALAMSIVMITGGIDLSIIASANLAGIIAAMIMKGILFNTSGIPSPVVILIAVVAALLCSCCAGLINGLLIAKCSTHPIIATLGTMTLFNGIGMAITSGQGVVGFSDKFVSFGTAKVGKMPLIFLLYLIITIAMGIFLSKTILGKKIYLYGENRIASRFTANKNEKIIILVYTICGFLVGIASLMIISRVNSAKVGYGDTYLLQAILVAVMGGIHPNGGRGKIVGVIISTLILQLMQSAFTIMQITPYAKRLIWGIMLVAIMAANYLIIKRSNKGANSKKATKLLTKKGSI